MNGFDFCVKVLERNANPRACFMSSGLINQEALRETVSIIERWLFYQKTCYNGESNFKSECRIRLDYAIEDSLFSSVSLSNGYVAEY